MKDNKVKILTAMAVAAIILGQGCLSVPPNTKLSYETAGYTLKVEYGKYQNTIANDITSVIERLMDEVSWFNDTVIKSNMSFKVVNRAFIGDFTMVKVDPTNKNTVLIHSDFRNMVSESEMTGNTIIDKDYIIKKAILSELVKREYDLKGINSIIKNLSANDFAAISNFMKIDSDLKAQFMIGGFDGMDGALIYGIAAWQGYNQNTEQSLEVAKKNTASPFVKITFDECLAKIAGIATDQKHSYKPETLGFASKVVRDRTLWAAKTLALNSNIIESDKSR